MFKSLWGEPTDRGNLIQIIEQFVKHCPRLKIINFTTNGLNHESLNAVAEYIDSLDIPIKGINVSIDGPRERHNRIRGTKDDFNAAIEAYKIVKKYKSIKSEVGMTLFPSNCLFIKETLSSIQEYISDCSLNHLHLNFPHASSHYYGNQKINYEQQIDIKKVMPFFKRNKSSLSPFELVE